MMAMATRIVPEAYLNTVCAAVWADEGRNTEGRLACAACSGTLRGGRQQHVRIEHWIGELFKCNGVKEKNVRATGISHNSGIEPELSYMRVS